MARREIEQSSHRADAAMEAQACARAGAEAVRELAQDLRHCRSFRELRDLLRELPGRLFRLEVRFCHLASLARALNGCIDEAFYAGAIQGQLRPRAA